MSVKTSNYSIQLKEQLFEIMDSLDINKSRERILLRNILVYFPKLVKFQGEDEKIEKRLNSYKMHFISSSNEEVQVNLNEDLISQENIKESEGLPLIYLKDK